MNNHDSPCVWRNRRFYHILINQSSLPFGLDQNWRAAILTDGKNGSNISISGDYDLVSWAKTVCLDNQIKGIQSIGYADAVLNTAICSKVRLELFNLLSKQIPA